MHRFFFLFLFSFLLAGSANAGSVSVLTAFSHELIAGSTHTAEYMIFSNRAGIYTGMFSALPSVDGEVNFTAGNGCTGGNGSYICTGNLNAGYTVVPVSITLSPYVAPGTEYEITASFTFDENGKTAQVAPAPQRTFSSTGGGSFPPRWYANGSPYNPDPEPAPQNITDIGDLHNSTVNFTVDPDPEKPLLHNSTVNITVPPLPPAKNRTVEQVKPRNITEIPAFELQPAQELPQPGFFDGLFGWLVELFAGFFGWLAAL